jgi:hypothetical protein
MTDPKLPEPLESVLAEMESLATLAGPFAVNGNRVRDWAILIRAAVATYQSATDSGAIGSCGEASDHCRVSGCVHAAHGCPTWPAGANPFAVEQAGGGRDGERLAATCWELSKSWLSDSARRRVERNAQARLDAAMTGGEHGQG